MATWDRERASFEETVLADADETLAREPADGRRMALDERWRTRSRP
jgi:hypothetical protein